MLKKFIGTLIFYGSTCFIHLAKTKIISLLEVITTPKLLLFKDLHFIILYFPWTSPFKVLKRHCSLVCLTFSRGKGCGCDRQKNKIQAGKLFTPTL